MRKKLNLTEGIFPMPVLMVATYNTDGSVNVMNAAWGTMQEKGNVALNLTETHKTVQNIKARGAFTVSIADAAHVVEADYFGVVSGNKEPKKFENSGLTSDKAETVDAPGFAPDASIPVILYGADDQIRTDYLVLTKDALYLLSYISELAGAEGFEPSARGFGDHCSTS